MEGAVVMLMTGCWCCAEIQRTDC